MATITFKRGDDYIMKISRLSTGSKEKICGPAIYAAADIVTDAIRRNLRGNLADPSYLGQKNGILFKTTKESSGSLESALGIASMKEDDGFLNVKIGFDGYDKNGVPNQMKARVMESGTSERKKAPFVRPAVKQTKEAAVQKMREIVDKNIEKIMKG